MENKTKHYKYGILLFFLLFGLMLLGLYVFMDKDTTVLPKPVDNAVVEENTNVFTEIDESVYETQIKNSLISVPDSKVKVSLVDGRASYGTESDGGDISFGKLIGGFGADTQYVFADMVVQSGGTGVFHYVALFGVQKGKVTHLSSRFIGDRIEVLGASGFVGTKENYTVTIDFLDRNIDEAMIDEPTVPKELVFEVRNNVFLEN
ncbi:MAG: hypothetical protein NTV02_00730 [Candidatus Zambryskibacteria bacterium]|nr:hypothetical protein [Candidatus Zambryskibacteria bacterium]